MSALVFALTWSHQTATGDRPTTGCDMFVQDHLFFSSTRIGVPTGCETPVHPAALSSASSGTSTSSSLRFSGFRADFFVRQTSEPLAGLASLVSRFASTSTTFAAVFFVDVCMYVAITMQTWNVAREFDDFGIHNLTYTT